MCRGGVQVSPSATKDDMAKALRKGRLSLFRPGLDARRAALPSPLAGEGGAKRRMRGSLHD
jgi:hypothetical protein